MAVKVLIVEDNPVARSFLGRVVRESFSDVLDISEAGDLQTARRQVGPMRPGLEVANPFKLVLVVLELPDGRGMDLLTELAPYPATRIVTTLYSDDDHLFPACSAGPTATCSRKTASRCWSKNCRRSCAASRRSRRRSRAAC